MNSNIVNLTKTLKKSKKLQKELEKTNLLIQNMLSDVDIYEITDLEYLYLIKTHYLTYLSEKQINMLNKNITKLEIKSHENNLVYFHKFINLNQLSNEEKLKLDFLLCHTLEFEYYFTMKSFIDKVSLLINKEEKIYEKLLNELVSLNILDVYYYLPCYCLVKYKNDLNNLIDNNMGILYDKKQYYKVLLSMTKKDVIAYLNLTDEEWVLSNIHLYCDNCDSTIKINDINSFNKHIIKLYKIKEYKEIKMN